MFFVSSAAAYANAMHNSYHASEETPSYAPVTEAYHRAFATELRALLAMLPLRTGDTVLDVACGDAAFSHWLVERVGWEGRVVALDLTCGWLQKGVRRAKAANGVDPCAVQANAVRLPFADHSVDFAWCAQSFRSLADVPAVLREMVRVVRPRGVVAVLENDSLHQILFPWNVELELAVRAAELEALRRRAPQKQGYYIARRLVGLLQSAGLAEVVDHAAAFVRQSPLDVAARTYFAAHLASLERRASQFLSDEMRTELDELLHGAGVPWFDRPDFSAVCLERLAWGFKPD